MSEPLTHYESYKLQQAYRWLRHVREVTRRMATLREQVEEERSLYDMVSAVRYGEKVSTSAPLHGDDRMAAHVERLDSLLSGMATEYAAYSETVAEARVVFAGLTVPCGQVVMSRHWLDGVRWADIADEVGYSVDHVHRIARRSALECHDLMPTRWRDPLPPAI